MGLSDDQKVLRSV